MTTVIESEAREAEPSKNPGELPRLAPEDPMPNPLLVPLSRYASGLEAVAAQGGCSVATADKLLRAVRLIRLAISGAPIDPTRPAPLTEEEARCFVTGNLCGTDTWKVGRPCRCVNCQTLLRNASRGEVPPEARAPTCPTCKGGAMVRAEGYDRDGFPHEEPCLTCCKPEAPAPQTPEVGRNRQTATLCHNGAPFNPDAYFGVELKVYPDAPTLAQQADLPQVLTADDIPESAR